MILLNLGCGATRPSLPWINIDTLVEYLSGPEWAGRSSGALEQLSKETNYINMDFTKSPLPFDACSVDAIYSSHCLEHLDCHQALALLKECYRVLKVGGVVRIGVPDASIFRKNFLEDKPGNTPGLYGETGNPVDSFINFALFYNEHKQIFTEDSLWCHFASAEFRDITRSSFKSSRFNGLADHDNRESFTLFMEGVK